MNAFFASFYHHHSRAFAKQGYCIRNLATSCCQVPRSPRKPASSIFHRGASYTQLQYLSSTAVPSKPLDSDGLPPCRMDRNSRKALAPRSRRHFMSWSGQDHHHNSRSRHRDGLSEGDEEAARSAILEKALKIRQPTDLLLRCKTIHMSFSDK